MLENKLKEWKGKKVRATYINRDIEGNIYCPREQFELLKKDIISQGFTFTDKEKTIEIDGTNQFFWKPRKIDNIIGKFNPRATKYEILDGKSILLNGDYPTRKDIIEYGDTFYSKKIRDGLELLIELI